MTGRLETRARLRAKAWPTWRTQCCGVLVRGQCNDCPLSMPMRPLSHQRARYPDDWHPFGYFMSRIRLFVLLAAIALVGAVTWMVAGML